jgi:hypothetical protein
MLIVALAFCLAGLLIILGFVALLKQKTYLDSATLQPVEIELPVVGRVKTNYPAIVFVILGFMLAYVAFEKSFPPRKVEWRLDGSLTNTNPTNGKLAWSSGTLALVPSEIQIKMYNQGAFEVTAMIEEGKTIEDVYETLDYSHPVGSAQIDLRQELINQRQGKPSLISSLTDHTRTYKPLELEVYPPAEH